MIFITIARLLRHLTNLAWIVHKKNLPKDLHSLIIIWPMLTKQADIISAKVSCHRLPVIG